MPSSGHAWKKEPKPFLEEYTTHRSEALRVARPEAVGLTRTKPNLSPFFSPFRSQTPVSEGATFISQMHFVATKTREDRLTFHRSFGKFQAWLEGTAEFM
jgi:hypothetical protein